MVDGKRWCNDPTKETVQFFFRAKSESLKVSPWWGIPLLLSYNAPGGGKADVFFFTRFFRKICPSSSTGCKKSWGALGFLPKRNGDLLGGRWAVFFFEEGAGPFRGFVAIQPGSPPTKTFTPKKKQALWSGLINHWFPFIRPSYWNLMGWNNSTNYIIIGFLFTPVKPVDFSAIKKGGPQST